MGEVLGDGVVLSFSKPSVVGVFDVCLRLNTEPSGDYKNRDFGFSNDELKYIYPLGFVIFYFYSLFKITFFIIFIMIVT